MHQLVTILKKKEDGHIYKADAVDEFCERYVNLGNGIFDWAVTDTVGRWEEEYPDNVLVGDDVIKRLEKVAEYQKEREKEIAEQIEKCIGNGSIGNPEEGGLLFWYLIGELSDRKLERFKSTCPEFVYLDEYSGNAESALADVRKNLDDYFVVLVDAHF